MILLWIGIAAVPAALTRQDIGSANSMRGIAGAAVMGDRWCGLAMPARAHSGERPALGLLCQACSSGRYLGTPGVLQRYFTTYPIEAARAFEYGIAQAMDYVIAHEDEVDVVVLTDWISQPHIFAVVFTGMEPAEFQRTHAPYGDRLSEKLTAWGSKYRVGDAVALYDQLEHGLFVVRPHMLEGVEAEITAYCIPTARQRSRSSASNCSASALREHFILGVK